MGIFTNVTLVFSVNQALLAARSGATYVSIFVGRIDDYSGGRIMEPSGMSVVKETLQVYKNYGYQTKIITASVRDTNHVFEAAKIGSHVATVPYSIFNKLYKHPLTDIGLEKFLSDYKQWKK